MDSDKARKFAELAMAEGYSDNEIVAKLKELKSEPAPTPKEDNSFSLSNMLKNVPSSLYNQGSMLVDAASSPVATAKSLGNMAAGGLYKANELADKHTPDAMDFMFQPIGGGDKVLG